MTQCRCSADDTICAERAFRLILTCLGLDQRTTRSPQWKQQLRNTCWVPQAPQWEKDGPKRLVRGCLWPQPRQCSRSQPKCLPLGVLLFTLSDLHALLPPLHRLGSLESKSRPCLKSAVSPFLASWTWNLLLVKLLGTSLSPLLLCLCSWKSGWPSYDTLTSREEF